MAILMQNFVCTCGSRHRAAAVTHRTKFVSRRSHSSTGRWRVVPASFKVSVTPCAHASQCDIRPWHCLPCYPFSSLRVRTPKLPTRDWTKTATFAALGLCVPPGVRGSAPVHDYCGLSAQGSHGRLHSLAVGAVRARSGATHYFSVPGREPFKFRSDPGGGFAMSMPTPLVTTQEGAGPEPPAYEVQLEPAATSPSGTSSYTSSASKARSMIGMGTRWGFGSRNLFVIIVLRATHLRSVGASVRSTCPTRTSPGDRRGAFPEPGAHTLTLASCVRQHEY